MSNLFDAQEPSIRFCTACSRESGRCTSHFLSFDVYWCERCGATWGDIPKDTSFKIQAISLWQPWATLMAIGAKRFETRNWECSANVPLAIHAAKRVEKEFCAREAAALDELGLSGFDYPTGAVLAVCWFEHCHRTDDATKQERWKNELRWGDFGPGRFAWQTSTMLQFRHPVPARGRQKIWNWKHTVLQAP